jgi:hypothetical protein
VIITDSIIVLYWCISTVVEVGGRQYCCEDGPDTVSCYTGVSTVVEVGGRRYCCEDCPDTDPSLSREASMAVDDDLQGPYTSASDPKMR